MAFRLIASICSMKICWLLGCFLGLIQMAGAQALPKQAAAQIQQAAKTQSTPPFSAAALRLQQYRLDNNLHNQPTSEGNVPLYAEGGLHYLQPLYEYLKSYASPVEKNRLSRHLAYAGDHLLADYFNQQLYDSMMQEGYQDVHRFLDTLGKIQLTPARAFIKNRIANERVVMFNENPVQLQQRAFFYSMLEDFYQAGFRYLSLYWLSPYLKTDKAPLNKFWGYQVADPVAGEIIRKARQLGFVLIPYGDSSINKRTANVQDAVQATRLASILQQDSSARILVLEELAHISELPIGDYTPMATVFSRISGIDPLTIDLTELSTGSSFEYGRYFYQELTKKINVDAPSVVMRNGQAVSLLENDQYDLQVLFPPAKNLRNRADWLTLSDNRKETPIRPTERELFLVQAYYADETERSAFTYLIPADQTYLTDRDGYYWLFLAPGKYKLVMRDIHYNMVSEKELTVE